MKIIKLNPSRWGEYREIRLETLRNEPGVFDLTPEEKDRNSEEDWKKDLKDFIESKGQVAFFAEDNGKIVGIAGAYRNKEKKASHVALLWGVYVNKDYRNKGVATKLLEAVLQDLQEKWGIIKIDLSVTTTQLPAINLYKKFGFQIVGELKKEYLVDGKFYDIYEMEKIIK